MFLTLADSKKNTPFIVVISKNAASISGQWEKMNLTLVVSGKNPSFTGR